MSKLYFRYGTVGSAKTLNLLAVAHNYRQQRKNVLLIKPEIDTRFGVDTIKTRAGLSALADVLAPPSGPLVLPSLKNVVCVLVDEVQFLTESQITQLHETAHAMPPESAVPVICYGLRTDFKQNLFPSISRLMALADSIEEIKNVCYFCLQKSAFNLRIQNGRPVFEGPVVDLGCEDKYLPVCADCYNIKRRTKEFSARNLNAVNFSHTKEKPMSCCKNTNSKCKATEGSRPNLQINSVVDDISFHIYGSAFVFNFGPNSSYELTVPLTEKTDKLKLASQLMSAASFLTNAARKENA